MNDRWKIAARILNTVAAVMVVLGGCLCLPAAGIAFIVSIWASADGGFSLRAIFSLPAAFASLVWMAAWPMMMVMGIALAALLGGAFLTKRSFYQASVILTAVFMLPMAWFAVESARLIEKPRGEQPVPPFADVRTFEKLKMKTATGWRATSYGRDKNHIYCTDARDAVIPGADPGTFDIYRSSVANSMMGSYAKDRAHVYYNCQSIVGADPGTFAILGGFDYARDAGRVYADGTALAADPRSFKLITGGYAMDSRHVFMNGHVIEGADPATFRMEGGYWRDRYRAYLGTKAVAGPGPVGLR